VTGPDRREWSDTKSYTHTVRCTADLVTQAADTPLKGDQMETLQIEKADGVAIVRLNRAPVNAVSKGMTRELRVCFEELSQDRNVGAVVLGAVGAEGRAVEMATQMAQKSPIALRLAKESILRIEGDQMMERYRTENDYTNRLRGYHDSQEAMAAFLDKRPAKWTWS
jgi:enoyl-CoA hydratase/carnithine racemase